MFVTPYLLADIGAGLGYIWGGFAFLVTIWAWFCMPELKVSAVALRSFSGIHR